MATQFSRRKRKLKYEGDVGPGLRLEWMRCPETYRRGPNGKLVLDTELLYELLIRPDNQACLIVSEVWADDKTIPEY